MGTSQAKKHLIKAIETDNLNYVMQVLKEYPMLMDEPLYTTSQVTPLSRTVWRGQLDIVMFLCEAGSNPNTQDKEGMTPLMWAAKRDYSGICILLLKFHASVNKRSREGLTALDYAIIHGNYESAYILFEFDKNVQDPLSYETIRQMKMWRYVDYESMIQQLVSSIQPQSVQDFLTKPQGKQYLDPVIDPRESWKDMFKRIYKFGPPPLCERSDLPLELQPQNRLLGRLNNYINGISLQAMNPEHELHQIVCTQDEIDKN